MYRSADSTELRRLSSIRPHQWDRDPCKVEVELHTAADEERAGQKLAILAKPHGDKDRRESDYDDHS